MEISSYLRSHARTLPGKSQLIISAFSKALEVIPRTICNNAGLDATDVLNKLRMLHARGETWAGVSVDDDSGNLGDDGKWGEGVRNNLEAFVWEPALVKVNALEGATEAACMVLSVDETVTNPSSQVSSRISLCSFACFPRRFTLSAHLFSNNKDLQVVVVWEEDEDEDAEDKKNNHLFLTPCLFVFDFNFPFFATLLAFLFPTSAFLNPPQKLPSIPSPFLFLRFCSRSIMRAKENDNS